MGSGLAGHPYLNEGKRMIDNITLWHKRARPEPTQNDFNVQLGCHIEEFVEMLQSISLSSTQRGSADSFLKLVHTLENFANDLKSNTITVGIADRKEFLDSLADQIVTAIGVGVCAKMDVVDACQEVNDSNWSKFNYKGFPEFDDNGKIKKGERYRKPNLEGMY